MNRTLKDYALISLKGIAMGAADLIPGVSGGTIAFITGIYEELLNTINSYRNRISAIGLGSHDFMASIGGKHTLQNLEVVRQHILYMAKAANIISIDIASMDLKDAEQFRSEVVDGFDKGYNAKFVIHPIQLHIRQNIKFYKSEK